MSTEDNKAIARRFVDEVLSKHDIGAIDQLFAADFVNHTPLPGVPPTRDGVKGFFSKFFAAFPDLNVSIHEQIAERTRVMNYMRLIGTHKGDFMGVPGTDNHIEIDEVIIMHLAGDEIAAYWVIFDRLSLMQQMGVISAPAQGR